MKCHDIMGREIVTWHNEEPDENGFYYLALYVNGHYVDHMTMILADSEEIAQCQKELFEEYGIEIPD